MSYQNHIPDYIKAIERYVDRSFSANEFTVFFMSLWKLDRDEEFAKRDTWARAYDQELIAMLSSGALTTDEFGHQWRKIWGLSKSMMQIRDLLDRVFTTCDVYNPEKERLPYEFDETQLRRELDKLLVELKKTMETLETDGINEG